MSTGVDKTLKKKRDRQDEIEKKIIISKNYFYNILKITLEQYLYVSL